MNHQKKLLSQRYAYDERRKNYFNDYNIRGLIKETKNILKKRANTRLIHNYCPLCKNENSTIISETERFSLPISFQICNGCGLIFSSEYFSNEFSEYYYSQIYNRYKNGRSAIDLFKNRISESAYCWKRYQYIKTNLGNEFCKIHIIMEPGCNDGCNLYPFHKEGKEVYGCDYDENRMEAGRSAGVNITSGSIDALLNLDIKADLIILSHVIAHIPNLDEFLQKVRNIIRPSGWVYIETPGYKWSVKQRKNQNNISGYKSNNDFLSFLQFEFCYIFELETLKLLLRKNGFKFIKGDEVIRSIFQPNTKNSETKLSSLNDRGAEIYNYLTNVENDYSKNFCFEVMKHSIKLCIKKFFGNFINKKLL